MITNIKRLRQTKRWAGLAAFLLGILAVLSVIYFIVILIAAMGAATDDECDTGGEQGGVVEGRISVIESPKYGQTAMMHIADAVHEKQDLVLDCFLLKWDRKQAMVIVPLQSMIITLVV